MFKEFYENKCKIPNGIYYNPETNSLDDVMFVHLIDESTIDIKFWKDLTYHPINIEFMKAKSHNFPQLKRDVWTLGSIYKNCYITPNNLHFIVKDNIIEVRYVDLEKLSLNDYIEIAHNKFLNKIKKIYDESEQVVIFFSGGIDSLHLLSYAYKLDMLHKTTLAYSDNFCVEHPSLIRNSPIMKEKLKSIRKNLDNQINHFYEHSVSNEDLYEINKLCNTTYTTYYTSFNLLKQFSNCSVMTGFFGNQIAFHSHNWLDHLLFYSSNHEQASEELKILLNDDTLYMNNFIEFTFDRNFFPYNSFTFNRSNFDEFDGFNNIKFYTPFAEAKSLCRQVKTYDLNFKIILDAHVAKEFIKINVGDLFDRYIYKTSEWDNDCCTDNMIDMLVNKKDIDPNLLSIPKNITIEDKNNYDKIFKLKKIPYRYIQNIISLHHLSKIHSKHGRVI